MDIMAPWQREIQQIGEKVEGIGIGREHLIVAEPTIKNVSQAHMT
jgi:hypothetical protein